jgi:hypothetical protein
MERDEKPQASGADSEPIHQPFFRKRSIRQWWSLLWRVIVGLVLIAFGGLMGLVPGVPGFVFAIAGLALMADEVPIAHRFLMRMRAGVKSADQKFRKSRRKKPSADQ